MPTYEYECNKCGETFELFQSMKDEPVKDCPNEACGGKGTVRRLIGAGAGVIFKGSGFYATDYKGSQPRSATKKEDSGAKSECSTCCPHAKEGTCPAKE